MLNDCKYGYATFDNIMRLSLLRAPKHPDPVADIGRHQFRYGLIPHAGDFRDAGIIDAAQAFNAPLLVRSTSAAPGEQSFFSVSLPNVIIDTVKKAEDDDSIVVRLYEAFGSHCQVRLRSALPVRKATQGNLLEESQKPVSWGRNGATLKLRPFEIVTLKLRR